MQGKKVKVITLGCKVNQYESQQIREGLRDLGYMHTEKTCDADICIINTCAVTHTAERKSLYAVNRAIRTKSPQTRIVVTGCSTMRNKEKMAACSGVDVVVPQHEKQKFFSYLGLESGSCHKGISSFDDRAKAFLKVQDGCNRFCSYCVIPFVRGSSVSRSIEELKEEAYRLVSHGYREIIVTGICLGDYGTSLQGDAPQNLVSLLEALDAIKGNFRIRLSSLAPTDVHDELIDCMASHQKICAHLHLSLQSGDDTILKQMNRAYTGAFVRKLVKKIRKVIPHMSVTTDVIVGFPEETDQCFQNTLAVLEAIQPARIHSFVYSPRQGTKAYELYPSQKVSSVCAQQRMEKIMRLGKETFRGYAQQFLTHKVEVLIEQKRDNGYIGYSREYLPVQIQFSPSREEILQKSVSVGDVCLVDVVRIDEETIIGEMDGD